MGFRHALYVSPRPSCESAQGVLGVCDRFVILNVLSHSIRIFDGDNSLGWNMVMLEDMVEKTLICAIIYLCAVRARFGRSVPEIGFLFKIMVCGVVWS